MTRIKTIKNTINKLLYVLSKRQKLLGIVLIILTIVNALLQTVGVAIVTPIVGIMSDPASFESGRLATWIRNAFGVKSVRSYFVIMCAITIFIYIVKEVFSIFHTWFSTKYTLKIERELSNRVFKSYMNRNYDFFLDYGTAKLLRDIREDTSGVNALVHCAIGFGVEAVTMAFIMVYITMSYWQIAICIGVLAVLCALLSFRVFKNWMKRSGEAARIEHANTQKVALEALQGIKEVQVMKKQEYFLDVYDRQIVKQQKPREVEMIVGNIPTYAIEGVFVIGIMIYMCISAVYDPNFSGMLPLLASVMVAAVRLLPSLGRMSSAMNYIPFYLPSLDSVYNNIHQINEYESQISDRIEKDSIVLDQMRDNLTLTDICWQYAGSDTFVLRNLCMTIKKGQSVGIVGQSGAGKSTLADIILGLHVPEEGTITIDGVSIKEIPDSYSDMIGYVSQSVYLFDGTVRENIAFGVKSEEIDDELIDQVVKQAQLDEFVSELDDGLDSIIGERGVKISGGQRQRIAIARALYRKPQILVLDEATSALDNETETTLMQEIEALYGTITMIIIAHRLTTVEKCDVIYEITDGRAIERTWDEINSRTAISQT